MLQEKTEIPKPLYLTGNMNFISRIGGLSLKSKLIAELLRILTDASDTCLVWNLDDEIKWNLDDKMKYIETFRRLCRSCAKMANQLITLDIFQFPSCYLWDVDIESDFLIQQQAFLSATDSAPKRKSPISISWYILKQKEKKYLYMEELWDYMRLVRGLGRASICLQMTPPTTNEKKSWSISLSTYSIFFLI